MSTPAAKMPTVNGGMNDQQAGEAFADYIEAAGGDDIDVFEGGHEVEDKKSAKASAPEESETKETDDANKPADADTQDDEDAGAETSADDAEDEEGSDDADADAMDIGGAELAGFLGVDEGLISITDDGAVLVKTQVDGVQGQATLGELVKGYQLEANVTRKSQQVAEERRELHERANGQMQRLDGAIQQATQMAEAMKGRTLAKYQGINWEELRASNPGEFAATYTQMQQEMQSLDYEVGNLQQVRQQAMEQSEAERRTNHATWVGEQRAAVFEQIPALANEETRAPLLKEYQTYLTDIGFNDDEIQGILDSRHLRVINDAVAGRRVASQTVKGKDVVVPVAKKLSRVPRTLKPGSASATTATKPRRTNRNNAAKRLRSSGSDEDAARFAIESGIVDNML